MIEALKTASIQSTQVGFGRGYTLSHLILAPGWATVLTNMD
jgi:hypothetical protein